MKKIVVIGAGYSGVLSAKKLEKRFKKDPNIEISIIDKNPYHTMLTELHEVAAGRVDEESIKMELSDIFAKRKVNVILDEVKTVDFENKIIKARDKDYDYDYLVIASGSKPTYFGTKGHELAFKLWSYEDAVKLKEHILHCFRAAACTTDPDEKRKLLTFSIVGSGFTGVEMAGELGEYKDELCHKFNIPVEDVTINIMDVVDRVLPLYPAHLVAKVERRFERLGVTPIMGNAVAEIGEDYLIAGENKIEGYTTVWAAGVEGSDLVDNATGIKQEGRGRYSTNKYLQSVDNEDVFIVGDNIFYIPEGEERPVPQMVENAEKSSECAAENLVSLIEGKEMHEYKPKFNGSMVCIGGKWGVAYIGSDPAKMKSFSGFIAMFIKHFINLVYFIQVLGLHKWYSYAKHEFFTVRENRSFLGGHFSNAKNAPTIFLVPLRIFLGVMWLASGLAKLPGILKDWTNVTAFPSKAARFGLDTGGSAGSTSSAAADTATAASGAATSGAADAAGAAASSGAADATASASSAAGEAVGSSSSVADASLSGFDSVGNWLGQTFELKAGNPSPTPGFVDGIMNWMYKTFFWSGDTGFTTLAALFQSGMVFAEIAVGGMFILGLLTPLAAIVSFIMMLAIYMSGWSYMAIFFYGFAGLACIFAGNSLGLDYYVLPWLDKKLRTWRFTRKWYLYFK